jgi:hypothetical protein
VDRSSISLPSGWPACRPTTAERSSCWRSGSRWRWEIVALTSEDALLDLESHGLVATNGEAVVLAHPLFGEAVRARLARGMQKLGINDRRDL